MIQLTDNAWAVEVPGDASDFEIQKYKVRNAITERDGKMLIWASLQVTHNFWILPPGTWQFLFTTKEVTEEQWMQIVDSVDSEGRGLVFMNYCNGMYVFSNAKSSGRSLLRSHGCD